MDLDGVVEWYGILYSQWEQSDVDHDLAPPNAMPPRPARPGATQCAEFLHTGRLGAFWRFPSDHLPVGCVFGDGLRVISWNVLNSRFNIRNVEGQGLEGSLLHAQYDIAGAGKLTLRDCVVLRILEIFIKGDAEENPYKATVLALQECPKQMLTGLRPVLERWGFEEATFDSREHHDDTVVIYNAKMLQLTSLDHFKHPVVKLNPFTGKRSNAGEVRDGKPLKMASWRRRTGPFQDKMLCIVAGKIAGDPSQKHLHEWAEFVVQGNTSWQQIVAPGSLQKKCKGQRLPWWEGITRAHTLFLGDFNFSWEEITDALQVASSFHGGCLCPQFVEAAEHDCYPTNISPDKDDFGDSRLGAKRIDHIMQVNPSMIPLMRCKMISADELLPRMQEEVDVLHCSGLLGSRPLPVRSVIPTLWEPEPADVVAWASELEPGGA